MHGRYMRAWSEVFRFLGINCLLRWRRNSVKMLLGLRGIASSSETPLEVDGIILFKQCGLNSRDFPFRLPHSTAPSKGMFCGSQSYSLHRCNPLQSHPIRWAVIISDGPSGHTLCKLCKSERLESFRKRAIFQNKCHLNQWNRAIAYV